MRSTNEVQGIARLKILPGKLEEFKRVQNLCMEVARTKDTGTIQYETYLNADETECIVLERYRDAAALMEHLQNIGGLMEETLATCTASGEVCGNLPAEMKKMFEGSPVQHFTPYLSL